MPQKSSNWKLPCVVLAWDNWDDFGYKTTFSMGYYDESGYSKFVGIVKILKNIYENDFFGGYSYTVLNDSFEKLDASYCSLGQSLEYYENLKALGESVYKQILTSLNDIVLDNGIANEFQHLDGFRKSLLRFSEAEKAFREAPFLLNSQEIPEKNFIFNFTCKVPGASAPHIVNFDFSKDETGLNRIIAIIGRNGTGKTQVLAHLALAMSGRDLDKGKFDPERPNFSKGIAISYSIFDEFDRPPCDEETFSYKYCGIREDDKLLTHPEIRKKLKNALKEVQNNELAPQWKTILSEVLGDTVDIHNLLQTASTEEFKAFDTLSSGQRILTLVLTEVIANIANESLILFDEPEIHLHPDVLSALVRSLHLLLEKFNSYAIVATHSPLLLQEIPAKRVRVFRREGQFPIVSHLGIESFGENLTTITETVFEFSGTGNNYRTHLKKITEGRSFDEVINLFDDKLSLNARAFLGTLYSEDI